MFDKVLIANRGEVALRIWRACKSLGLQTVAVYSKADRDLRHVKLADTSICIGPASASKSYLLQQKSCWRRNSRGLRPFIRGMVFCPRTPGSSKRLRTQA